MSTLLKEVARELGEKHPPLSQRFLEEHEVTAYEHYQICEMVEHLLVNHLTGSAQHGPLEPCY